MNWYDVAPEEPESQYLDAKVVPAEIIKDYKAGFTGEQMAEKWGTSPYWIHRIITDRDIPWKHPELRQE